MSKITEEDLAQYDLISDDAIAKNIKDTKAEIAYIEGALLLVITRVQQRQRAVDFLEALQVARTEAVCSAKHSQPL